VFDNNNADFNFAAACAMQTESTRFHQMELHLNQFMCWQADELKGTCADPVAT
jgi:hypothetical protein